MKTFDNSELSVRALNVLRHLGVYSANDLINFSLPKIGTLIYRNYIANVELYYTARVDKEIREFLNS